MDATSTLLGLAVLVMILAVVLRPLFVGPSGGGERQRAAGRSPLARQMEEQAHLLERRNAVYAAIRDLDFEYSTGKISEEDHASQRAELMEEGVAVLKQLDRVVAAAPSEDSLEAAIAAVRRGEAGHIPQASVGAERAANGHYTCTVCDSPVKPDDRFCGTCGASLEFEYTCPACSTPYQPGDLFCAHCGAALEAQG